MAGSDPRPSVRLQACAVPYRQDGEGEVRYLLITSSGGGRWIFPKGVVEPGRTPHGTATIEAVEEAGVRGALTPEPLRRYRRRKWGAHWEVWVYALACTQVEDDWPESWRKRQWLSYDEARALLSPRLRRTLRAVHRSLKANGAGGPEDEDAPLEGPPADL